MLVWLLEVLSFWTRSWMYSICSNYVSGFIYAKCHVKRKKNFWHWHTLFCKRKIFLPFFALLFMVMWTKLSLVLNYNFSWNYLNSGLEVLLVCLFCPCWIFLILIYRSTMILFWCINCMLSLIISMDDAVAGTNVIKIIGWSELQKLLSKFGIFQILIAIDVCLSFYWAKQLISLLVLH